MLPVGMFDQFASLGLEDEVEYMDTSDTPWHWFYQAESGAWHRVEDDPENFMSSDDLERYYHRNQEGVIRITTAGGPLQIDFAAKTQVNLKTGKTRWMKRSFHTENSFRDTSDDVSPTLPAHWDRVDPRKPYQLISLRNDSPEYQTCERFVKNVGLLPDPIISIRRIQNMDLWELFNRKKTQLMRIKGQSDIEVQMLFHGTSARNVHSICTYNFNCKLPDSRRHGHVLGKGTYFAKHASLASKYCDRDRLGTRVLLLSRVIVGKYRTGRSNYCTPDDDKCEIIHNSCVDDELCPRIFVIFDSDQIYPEYVLEYR